MSLDVTKLERVAEVADGVRRARCPACAESGSDRTGVHLRIYPDGKFGCCVHPGDREHRKRIYALAGARGARGIKVRVAAAKSGEAVQRGILGRLGQAFPSAERGRHSAECETDGPDGGNDIETMIAEWEEGRTERTGENESKEDMAKSDAELRTERTGQEEWTGELFESERTLRTPQLSLCTAEQETERKENNARICKDIDRGVRCVREAKEKLPHLTSGGDLSIPFGGPERYHWWKGGQSVKETLAEIRARAMEVENGATF